ncbi:hypothetical protein RRG08_044325 [Elysia crispata]|uniref:Uncharacterized protein n=1 Tax=Elysia crispata TaxID=231223 RepID=A0AAE0Z8J4_9GAST|nr:hypothetical protein RRG08_044325 [Elysia crispata]
MQQNEEKQDFDQAESHFNSCLIPYLQYTIDFIFVCECSMTDWSTCLHSPRDKKKTLLVSSLSRKGGLLSQTGTPALPTWSHPTVNGTESCGDFLVAVTVGKHCAV